MISQAELNAMERLTPTGIAERRFGGGRVGKMTLGPSGMPIPRARAVFRPTLDGPLLDRIATTAIGAYARQRLPEDQRAWVAEILLDDIEARFPQADMLVLQKYEHAHPVTKLFVELPGYKTFYIDLPSPVVLVRKAASFAVEPHPEGTMTGVPEVTMPFFNIAIEVEQQREALRGFAGVTGWPRRFNAKEKRHPRWEEIEAAFPVLGEWLAAERKRMEGKA